MAVTPSVVATIVSTYVPPFVGVPTTSASAAGPSQTSDPSNPSVPAGAATDGAAWIKAYLSVHKLSSASYRYAYLMWIVILFFGLLFAFLHWTGFRGGVLGASFDKWAYRRRTWRKKHALKQVPHRQPKALPSNAQILSLVILLIGPIALSFVGADYIKPGTPLWDLANNLFRAPKAVISAAADQLITPPQSTIEKAWWTSGNRMGLIAFALFPLSVLLALKAPPFALFALPILTSLHFDKLTRLHKWCGRIIYLLTVGHVVAWVVQLSKDRQTGLSDRSALSVAILYQDFIWAIIAFICFTLLVILSIGPIRDRFYESFKALHIILVALTLIFSALHFPPLSAWCWAALGLWVAERLWRWGRQFWVNGAFGGGAKKGETVGKGRYAPPTPYTIGLGQEWAAAGPGAGAGQRGAAQPGAGVGADPYQPSKKDPRLSYISDREKPLPIPGDAPPSQAHAYPPINIQPRPSRRSDEDSFTDSISEYYQYDAPTPQEVASPTKQGFVPHIQDMRPSMDHSPGSSVDLMTTRPGPRGVSLEYGKEAHGPYGLQPLASSSTAGYAATPAGFAHAVALPGRTVRLTLQTARPLMWAPGQHVLLRVPALSRLTMHPFTIATCSDKEERSELVLIIRARKGLTKQLWSYVHSRSGPGRSVAETLFTASGRPKRGVLMPATVDGPYGSAERARWGEASTVVIVVGGSGVSFGTAIMEYLCLCLRGRDGKTLGGRSTKGGRFKTERIRFVWTVREYSHIQWAAPIIRRCLDLVPRNTLQVDIFVTNGMKNPISQASTDLRTMAYQSEVFGDDDSTLAPPMAQFAKPENRLRTMSNSSTTSVDSVASDSSVADLDYATDEGGRVPRKMLPTPHGEEEEPHILDMTNFDDEDDTRMPGEAQLSQKVRKEGKVRRAISRKVTNTQLAKKDRRKKRESAEPSLLAYNSPIEDSPLTSTPAAPPSSFRPPGETAQGRPRSYYPPGHPGRRSDDSLGFDDPPPRQRVVSSADMYADGADPLAFGPPAPVRPPRAQRTPMGTPMEERLSGPFSASSSGPLSAGPYSAVSDGHRYEYAMSPSSETLQQYSTPYDPPHVRPSHYKRESTQSSVYTIGDPNYDARTLGAGESVRSLVDRKGQPPSAPSGHHRSESKVEMDDWEVDDLNVVSEMARPGRPKLDRILADEVERAHGQLAVACCGPASLNAMVRKVVAAQINPSRLLRGDKRGRITLVTEDFEW